MKAIALGFLFNDIKPSRLVFYILMDVMLIKELKDDLHPQKL